MLWAPCGLRRPCPTPSLIPKWDIRLVSRAPMLGIPFPMGFLFACPWTGSSRTFSVARPRTAPVPSHVSDIWGTHPEGEGLPKPPTRGCRCSIVVIIPACHAGLIPDNGAPRGHRRPYPTPSSIPMRDICLVSRAPTLGIPFSMGFLIACLRTGSSRTFLVAWSRTSTALLEALVDPQAGHSPYVSGSHAGRPLPDGLVVRVACG